MGVFGKREGHSESTRNRIEGLERGDGGVPENVLDDAVP